MNEIIQLVPPSVKAPDAPLRECGAPAIGTDTVYVAYTSIADTLAAARVAGGFAKALGVPVTIVHLRTVPYPLPIDEPDGISPVETDAFTAQLHAVDADMRVRVYLCRDARRAVPSAFTPHSLIVVAGPRRWWPTRSERWRRALEAAGHFVVVVDPSRVQETSHA
jgi:hypothetical protein